MTARNMPTQAELDAWAQEQVAKAPPLTQQQVRNLQRLTRPRTDAAPRRSAS